MKCSQDRGIALVASLFRVIRSHFSPRAARQVLVMVALVTLSAAAYVAVVPSTGEAALCVKETVAFYKSLLSDGCIIGDKIFSNFDYEFSSVGPVDPILHSGVLVTPLDDPDNPGLTFTVPGIGGWVATSISDSDIAKQSLISFDVRTKTGKKLIKDARVDAVFTGTGSFSDDVSEFGCFEASFTTFCSGATGFFFLNMYNHSGSTLNYPSGDSTIFSSHVALLGVHFVSIEANAIHGTGNLAIITSATFHYSEEPAEVPTEVPEPATAVLIGTGLLGLVSPRLLRHRR